MEKSLLSFAATYPDWLPGPGAAGLLSTVGPAAGLPLNGAFDPRGSSNPNIQCWLPSRLDTVTACQWTQGPGWVQGKCKRWRTALMPAHALPR